MFIVKLFIVLILFGITAIKSVRKNEQGDYVPRWGWLAPWAVITLSVMFLLLPAFGAVPAGSRGVVLRFGGVTGRILNTGAYLVTPFVESVEMMNTQTMAHAVKATAASKDLQDVSTEVTVNFHMRGDQAGNVYEDYRRDYITRILDPAVQEAVKMATAHFNAEDLIAQRQSVKDQITDLLIARLSPTHELVALSITDFSFSDVFSNAIEAKVTATQAALEEKNKLEAEKFKAEQVIVKARGEAEKIRIQAQAITSQGGAEYVNLMWVQKWDGVLPNVMAGGENGTMLMMNLGSGDK